MKYTLQVLVFLLSVHTAFTQQQMQVKKNDYSTFAGKSKSLSSELIANTSDKNKQHPEYGILPANAPCSDCYEDLDKRTIESRYFIKNNSGGKDFYIQKANGQLNYLDDEGFLNALDYQLYPTASEHLYEAASQPLPITINCANGNASITLADKFNFEFNAHLKMYFLSKENINHQQFKKQMNYQNYSAGRDGVYITDAFPKTDCEMAVRQGAIKTNFIIKDKSIIPASTDYLVIEDFVALPAGYYLKEDSEHGYYLKNGFWKGDINLYNESSIKLLKIERPIVLDNHHEKFHDIQQYEAAFYKLIPADGGYVLQILIETSWLLSDERMYPVIIDPTLIGEAVYTAGDIGFEFNSICFDDADYCNYFLDITVPGKTTLTAAYFDGTYYSQNFGCFFTTDCLMKEAGFRILGPCDDSPSPTSFWTCLPPAGDTAGTCYGIDLDMFNTIACIEPQCDDYEFTFEMRTFMCSCTKPPCDITCHYMPSGSWVITIEGKTVEETNIESDLFPEFTICQGDTIDLFAGGVWGVPPYYYEWSTGEINDSIYVWPDDTTTYTSIIHDLCEMKDTVYQIVNVIPSPELSPGPFEGCFETIADAGAGYSSYLWSTGETTQTIVIDSAGIYYVTVTDATGCSGISDPIDVLLYYPPEINAYPDTIYIENGELAELHVETTSSGDVIYEWSPAAQVTCLDCTDPLGIVTEAQVEFYVTGEENGCLSQPDTIVVINASTDFIMPNAFSPNGDGLNDTYQASSEIYYPIFQLQIFDRWGELIFESNDMATGWDGTYLNKQQEIGTYVWVVNYEKLDERGKPYTRKGTVVLLR